MKDNGLKSEQKNKDWTSINKWWIDRDLKSKFVAIIAIVMCIYSILFVSGILSRLGVYILSNSHRALLLAFVLALTYLIYPAKRKREKNSISSIIPWYDALLMGMGLVGCLYFFIFSDLVDEHIQDGMTTTAEVIMFFCLLLSMLEAGRRTLGPYMPAVVALFVFYSFNASYFPGMLKGAQFPLDTVVLGLYLLPEGVFGIAMGVASTIVIIFVILGVFLATSGAGQFFIDLSMALVGRFRGGPAKAAVVGSGLMGTISGSVTANVATTGAVTIPLMKKTGYTPEFAGAVESVASNGGQIMPPIMGVAAFVMASVTGIPYSSVIVAAFVPAALYYIALFVQIDLEAARLGLLGLNREELPSLKKVLQQGWHFLIPVIALLIFLLGFAFTPELSGLWALGTLFIVSYKNKNSRVGLYKVLVGFENAGRAMVVVGTACGLAGLIIGSVGIAGTGIGIAIGLLKISGGSLHILLGLTAAACFILGMGMTTVAIYLMLVVLIAPALVDFGIPLLAAHLFIVYWGLTSFITPPVCIASYVAASFAKSKPMATGWLSSRLGFCNYVVPFLFIYRPGLLFMEKLI